MDLLYRTTTLSDFEQCIEIRGKTRDNPVPINVLNDIGVNKEAWFPLLTSEQIVGFVCEVDSAVVGFCYGDVSTGEILVLALLPEFEGRGIGKVLLSKVSELLLSLGAQNLWLAASSDTSVRAHGFYRYLGWSPTDEKDKNGDEILVWVKS